MHDVNAALMRIEMDALVWVNEFEAALERIAIRNDRSGAGFRTMTEAERDHRTHGPLHREENE